MASFAYSKGKSQAGKLQEEGIILTYEITIVLSYKLTDYQPKRILFLASLVYKRKGVCGTKEENK